MRRLILLSVLVSCVSLSWAQQQQQFPALPIDSSVRYGVLENGLTYYIRHNENPKDQAEFYIAQKVGSMVEEESQRGLAHFLEHMAFNGTKHFPGKSMLNYLESLGVKFGVNINAYTSLDETVYNLSSVPVVREGVVDSCLLILSDWASGIALEDKEIDSERGVIIEEWRTSQTGVMRNYTKLLPLMYGAESRYANRLPIGLTDVIANFSYQTLKDYYHTWYRPDLQGVMIVGDIDVDRVEAKVKEMFSKVSLDANRAKRVWFEVADNKLPIVAIAADKEQPQTQLTIYYKHEDISAEDKKSVKGLAFSYVNTVMQNMFAARIAEIVLKPNAPFMKAYVYDHEFFVASTKRALTAAAICKEDAIEPALAALVTELEKVNRFGFTESEYERARAEFLNAIDNAYAERAKQKSETYVEEYVNHFIKGGSIAGMEAEYELYKQLIAQVKVKEVNEYVQSLISDDNVVISLLMPEKEGVEIPTQKQLAAAFDVARKAEVVAYVDQVSDKPLIATLPKAGKVVKTVAIDKFGATEWVLSNGAKVIVKPTDFKDNQILLSAQSKGGYSLLTAEDAVNAKMFDNVATLGGLGEFSPTELKKVLSGKRVAASPTLSEISEGMSGSSSIKDLETLLQLNYLMFTAPRKDVEVFEAWKERTRTALNNQDLNPMMTLSDSLNSTLYANHPFRVRMRAADVDRVDYDRILQIYKERFADASDFTFTFVGNVDPQTLKPLVEQYIASLPSKKGSENYRDLGVRQPKGEVVNEFTKQVETPKASVYMVASGDCKYTPENRVKMSLLKSVMDNVFLETLREEEGGTYGAGVRGSIDPALGRFSFLVVFDTNSAQKNALMGIVRRELVKMAENGPKPEELAKMREYLLKKHKENLKENSYWQFVIDNNAMYGLDLLAGYEDIVNAQSVESIRDFAAQIFGQGNMAVVAMDGQN